MAQGKIRIADLNQEVLDLFGKGGDAFVDVDNDSGGALSDLVFLSGYDEASGRWSIVQATNTDSEQVFGKFAYLETSLANGATRDDVVSLGLVPTQVFLGTDEDGDLYGENDVLYLSTGGEVTNNKPASTSKIIPIGRAVDVSIQSRGEWTDYYGYIYMDPRTALDDDAIHSSIANEIKQVAENTFPAGNDILLLENASASPPNQYQKEYVTFDNAAKRIQRTTVSSTLTSSDDSTISDTANSNLKQLIEGSGVNYARKLPSATLLDGMWEIIYTNASSEFIHIFNFDSSKVWHIPPTCTGVFRCTDTSTTAGGWNADISTIDPLKGWELVQEQRKDVLSEHISFTGNNGTTGSISFKDSLVTYYGIGTDAGEDGFGGERLRLDRISRAGGFALEKYIALSALPDATDQFTFYLALDDQASVGDEGYGAYLFCNYDAGTIYWEYKTVDSVGNNAAVSSEAVTSGAWTCVRIEQASDFSRFDFWVDNVHLGSSASNLSDHVNWYARSLISRNSGTSNNRYYNISRTKYTAFYDSGSERG